MSFWMEALLWFLLAVGFAIIEILFPAVFLVFLSLGAVVASILALLGAHEIVQALAFVIFSTLFLVFARPMVKHFLERNKKTELSCVYNVKGAKAIVTNQVNQMNGKVKIMNTGEIWTAYTYEHFDPIKENTQVIVKDIDGAKLIVIPKSAADREEDD